MLIYAIGKLYHMPWEKKSNNSRKRRFSGTSTLVNSLYEELFLFYNILIRRWHLYMLQKKQAPIPVCKYRGLLLFCSLYNFSALCTPFGFVSPDERAHLSALTAAPLRSAPRLRFCSPAFQDGRRRWNRTSPASRTRRPRRGRGPSCPL